MLQMLDLAFIFFAKFTFFWTYKSFAFSFGQSIIFIRRSSSPRYVEDHYRQSFEGAYIASVGGALVKLYIKASTFLNTNM